MRGRMVQFAFVLGVLMILDSSCYRMRKAKGGGQINVIPSRIINEADIALHPGYSIEPVLTGLTFPTAVTFDDSNTMYVLEAGYSYGEVWEEPKLLRVNPDQSTTVVAKGMKNGPWTGVAWSDGYFYIAEGGALEGGKILRVDREGNITAIASNLPSIGDHHTNVPVVKDGYVYFGQGVATNSGVVGEDNAQFGWLRRQKAFHDIPCADIELTGQNYVSKNVFDSAAGEVSTGAFVPFGTSTKDGQIIKGAIPCTGSIMRVPVGGGDLELVAWGLRNPFGLTVAPNGKMYVTENAYDERGSRPVWGAGDVMWEVTSGAWYGWPDFSAGKRIDNDEEFKSPKHKKVTPLLKKYPNSPPKPVAIFGVHSSANGLDFSNSNIFGFQQQAFVAQFGDMAGAGKVLSPVGFKIVRVDVSNGIIRDFAVNKGKKNGPASWLGTGGLERPVSVKFDRAGTVLYVVDFGIMKTANDAVEPQSKTGVVWKITKQ